jgi:hypothetical protein
MPQGASLNMSNMRKTQYEKDYEANYYLFAAVLGYIP